MTCCARHVVGVACIPGNTTNTYDCLSSRSKFCRSSRENEFLERLSRTWEKPTIFTAWPLNWKAAKNGFRNKTTTKRSYLHSILGRCVLEVCAGTKSETTLSLWLLEYLKSIQLRAEKVASFADRKYGQQTLISVTMNWKSSFTVNSMRTLATKQPSFGDSMKIQFSMWQWCFVGIIDHWEASCLHWCSNVTSIQVFSN